MSDTKEIGIPSSKGVIVLSYAPKRKPEKKPSTGGHGPISAGGSGEGAQGGSGAGEEKPIETATGGFTVPPSSQANQPDVKDGKNAEGKSKISDLTLYEARVTSAKIIEQIYKKFEVARKVGREAAFRALQNEICDNSALLFASGAMSIPELNKALMDMEEFITTSKHNDSPMADQLAKWLNGSSEAEVIGDHNEHAQELQ